MKVAASAHRLPIAPHFIPEIHVHVACAIPNALVLEYLPIFERPLRAAARRPGRIARPSEAPGHGMVFSDDYLEPFLMTAASRKEVTV